ncbi:PREDICTED: ubiquitin carboxyl-terminal hydrolase MINDY-1 [Ipomoea nil]|uniref:ubiquitin carboxyl-terminal hydrolase MINDY-1 n=1 Tax=Ipomoea nil TaxID=35883 RepID=UPI000900B330|nr:PREDICTED: ubiquitin carboxyl-terminal hydrolase MINDY-1 [Ipomoea nil]
MSFSAAPSSSTTATTPAADAMQEESQNRDEPAPAATKEKEMVHKTKVIQFLGRTTPIILQNDNGPCPLLAICNVLLLKNNLNLSPDVPEVSQEKLLSLVAERLIDSNSNVNDKDAGYVENQQQNIADAIDLLPRLTTGIDVNIKFRRIDDFEFTRECAIFDLLDIPLYHGWIVDPQDHDTANAIGLKSYNTLMGELVALETEQMESEHKKSAEDDVVDFAAATTAALGVPSPSLSRGRSFDDSPVSVSDHQRKARKGDLEEEEELMRVLKLSEVGNPDPSTVDVLADGPNSINESAVVKDIEPLVFVKTSEANSAKDSFQHESPIPGVVAVSDDCIQSGNFTNNPNFSLELSPGVSPKTDLENASKDFGKTNFLVEKELVTPEPSVEVISSASESHVQITGCEKGLGDQSTSSTDGPGAENNKKGSDILSSSSSLTPCVDSDLSSGRKDINNEPETFSSSVDGSEPIYEGEECIMESEAKTYENHEPMYEGEVVLTEQVGGDPRDVPYSNPIHGITPREGELIRNFLKISASQLTIYGLFCLQDGLKERELCVFFRNNHFNTMFKFEGDLYILATDQGFINQPELVWEKLNEVNGNTQYVTGNFKEFKVETLASTPWDEQSALANTADYLASIDNAAQGQSNFNSDLQLAIALQQQEFEQQQAQQNTRNQQQPTINGGSGLITGPQVSRYSGQQQQMSSSARQEPKSAKDKCIVM